MFEELIGQETAKEYLARVLAEDRLAHAYLFHGLAGVGKRTLARVLLGVLACGAGEGRACGRCPGCRMFVSGTHPDLHVLDGADRPIGIAQVRQLRQGLRYRPYGDRHLCLIQNAEGLTTEAANSLLKTLEEPQSAVLFVLTSARPDHLPPTVVSRCLRLPFRPLTRDEIVAGLEKMGFKGPVVPVAAALAGGSLGRAAAVAAGRDAGWRDQAIALAEELLSGAEPARLFVRARELGERAELLARAEILLLWYRDLLLWRETGRPELLANTDRLDRIREQAGRVTTPALIRSLNVIEEVRRKLSANANVRLAAEVLCLGLAGLVKEDGHDEADGWRTV